jgi:hypothetical protein
LVALASLMRLSLIKAAHAAASSVARQEIRGPVFPVGIGGAGEPHAAFFNQSRTRGSVQCSEAGNPGVAMYGVTGRGPRS